MLAVAVLAATGCSNDLESLFGDAGTLDSGVESGTEQRARPTDPFDQAIQLFDSNAECIAFMEDNCTGEATACADDEDCTRTVKVPSLSAHAAARGTAAAPTAAAQADITSASRPLPGRTR